MSGGKFDYVQYRIDDAAEQLKHFIDIEENPQKGDYSHGLSRETIDKFKECYRMLTVSGKMLHRIDWLLSGDDGEETFHERLEEDLSE